MEVLNDESQITRSLVFDKVAQYEHEQIVFCHDKYSGLKGIIAVHDTTLGPGLGGTRMYNYESEEDALVDVLRLSRGMTYKASISGLNLGGGKAVIIGDPNKQKSEALFRKFGQYINNLNGKYITAEDIGTTTRDMEFINMETKNVVGLPKVFGGGGDPSPVTAYGVYLGMKASANKVFGSDSLSKKKILVEGVGKVGMELVNLLNHENAEVFVADVDDQKLKKASSQYGVKVKKLDEIYSANVDIYAPCALGATLNNESIPELKCSIIAGAANNQLADEEHHGQMLFDHGILYTPDYLINAGGLINVFTEWTGYNHESAMETTKNIYEVTKQIISKSQQENVPTNEASQKMADDRINQIGSIHLKG